MIMQSKSFRILLASLLGLTLAACQTVTMPKIDLMKSSEFSEEAKNIETSYPRVKDAPLAPDDIRPAEQWDQDAIALQRLRDEKGQYSLVSGPDPEQSKAEFDALKAKVQAYKKDDPATGPIQGFPAYKPRQ
jgi:hypothetical protein